MIDVSDKVKELFTDGQSHDYSMTLEFGSELYFEEAEITLTEEDIKAETDSISESICTEETLRFGLVNASKFSCTLLDVADDLKGKYMRVTYYVEGNAIPFGRYYVESCDRVPYSIERSLVAYDYNYFFNVDASDFYLNTALGLKSSELTKKVFDVFKLQYTMPTFLNDTATVGERTYSSITYGFLLQSVGEINAGWWRPNRYGVMEFYSIDTTSGAEIVTSIMPQSATYEVYRTPTYDSVVFNGLLNLDGETEENTSYTYGDTDNNPYVSVTDNVFCVGKMSGDLASIGEKLLPKIYAIAYRPTTVRFDGRPYLEVGDKVTYYPDDEEAEVGVVTTYILSQTITGIGALVHSIESKGVQSSSDAQSSFSSASSASFSYAGTGGSGSTSEKQLQAYKDAMDAITNLIIAGGGLYKIEEVQPDGSTVYYLCNQPTLEQSDTIWTWTENGIMVSKDGATTWAIDVNGNALFNVLIAHGLSADWVTTGDLTVGGESANADGAMKVYDADNNLICKIDKTGFYAILGSLADWQLQTGELRSEDGTVRLNSKENALKFYSSAGTLLTRLNNAGLSNYDSNGILRSLINNTDMAFYDSSGKKRIDINSDGIKQYDTDGTYLGHLGRGTVYAVDSSGDITSTEIGEIMSVELEETNTSLGWSIFARVPDSEITAKQRRVYYCNADNGGYQKDTFYINCEAQILRHTESDPYYTKNIAFDSANKTFTVTAGCGAWEDTTHNVVNTFEWTEDASGNVTSIYNKTTGRMLKVQNG